jgi:hypothetical protein
MVSSAIRRARQGANDPDWTRAQSLGSRWASSNACARRLRPDPVERPSAVASSATANSDTRGAPCPASGIPVS